MLGGPNRQRWLLANKRLRLHRGPYCDGTPAATPRTPEPQNPRRTPEPQNPRTPEPLNPRTPEPLNPRTPEPQNPRTPEPLNPSKADITPLRERCLGACSPPNKTTTLPAPWPLSQTPDTPTQPPARRRRRHLAHAPLTKPPAPRGASSRGP